MKRRFTFFAPLCFCFLSKLAGAQSSLPGMWLGLQAPVKINSKWGLHNDAGYRSITSRFLTHQALLRTGIRYFVSNNWNTAAGLALFLTRVSYLKHNNEFGKEFRLWQELSYQQKTGTIQFQNRFMTEERFFSAVAQKSKYVAVRLREKISLLKSVYKNWSVQLAEEYMQQWAHQKFVFEQNRLMANIIYNLTKNDQVKAGYMWQLQGGISKHILNVNFQKTIDL